MSGNSTEMLIDADGHPNVVAWRLGQVEQSMARMSNKLDLIVENYPTIQTLSILLDPIKSDLIELQEKNKGAEAAKNSATAQLKLAIFVAVVSPVFSLVVTLIMMGGNKP